MARRIAIEIFLVSLVGVVLGLIGPFGTFVWPVSQRVLLWVLMVLAGYPVFRGAKLIAGWIADATPIPPAIALVLTLAVGALPMTFLIGALFLRITPNRLMTGPAGATLYLEVLLVALVTYATLHLLLPVRESAVSEPAHLAASLAPEPVAASSLPSTPPASPPGLSLPPGFGPVIALEAEDHYVRVHGATRDSLILIRLRDAIALLGLVDGAQVHRGWWVARDAVEGVEREGRGVRLRLARGLSVPVSRDIAPELRAAGWW